MDKLDLVSDDQIGQKICSLIVNFEDEIYGVDHVDRVKF